MVDEVAVERCAAGEQTVVGVRKREGRQEGEGLGATAANTAADLDPVTVGIVSLFATAPMADDGRAFTKRALPRQEMAPVRLEVVLLTGT